MSPNWRKSSRNWRKSSRIGPLFLPGLFVSALFISALDADPTPSPALLVLSKGDHTLAVVNPATMKVVFRAPSGPDPHEVIASTDGTRAYISNYGGGAYNTLTVVDLVAQKPLPTIDLGPLRGPHGLVFTGGKVWFTAEGAKVIGSYDPQTQKVDWVLGTGQNRTHMLYVTADLKRIFTSNVSSATITMIDKTSGVQGGPGPGGPPGPRAGPPAIAPSRPGMPEPNRHSPPGPPPGPPQPGWDETVIPVGRGAEGFDLSPDGRELWAANAQDGTVSIIDIAQKKVVATLPANVNGANRLKFTPDGKLVLISTLGGADLVVYNTQTRTEIKRVPIGHGAAGIQMQPDGARAFVACTPDSYVAIIDLKTLEVAGHLDAGREPDGLAWLQ